MENDNLQGTRAGYANGTPGGTNGANYAQPTAPAQPAAVNSVTPVYQQPVQQPQMPAASPPAPVRPPRKPLNLRKILKLASLALLVILLLFAAWLVISNIIAPKSSQVTNDAASRFKAVQIPLSELAGDGDLSVIGTRSLTINGSVRANSAFILSPSGQPSNANRGQIYYDNTSNQLAYYNGSEFVTLTDSTTTNVQNIGGISGSVALGDGITAAGGVLANAGVLSVQGQTGNVTLTSGGGLAVDGTTLTNTGVLSVGGQTGAIGVGSGLSVTGGTLTNEGVVSLAAGSLNLVITNDGAGNLTISDVGGGSGTVQSPGGTAGRIAKFTGVQTIEDSLLSETGTTVTVHGDLTVNGDLNLANALSVSNGGTGATALTNNGVVIGAGAGALTAVSTGTPGLCLVSTAGAPIWDNCTGSASVASLNGLTGALTLANASGAGSTVTINDASTIQKGIAQFNATNFSASGGVINTIQNINTGASPTFNNQTLSGDLAVNGGDVTSSGALNVSAGTVFTLQGNASSVINATTGVSTTTLAFQSPTADVTYRFATATAGTYDVCTMVGNCAGVGGGVTTSGGTPGQIAKFTGSQTLGDSLLSEVGSTVTVSGNLNVTTGSQFQVNGTQISSANLSNDANLAKLNATQMFTGGANSFRNGVNSTTAFSVQNAATNRILTVDTTNGEVELGTGGTLDGRLVFANGINANTITLVSSTATANRTITLPNDSGTICLSTGNCAGAGVTLQTAYNNSTTPELTVDATRGALTIRDAATPIGANLLEVQNNVGGTTYFAVTSGGTSTTGTSTVSGNINSSAGALQTGGTTRVDNTGNLVNIGNLTLSGAISGGTTYSGSGNINTTGGALQTAGTNRVDNTGNLVNIGNITGSGAITVASSGAGNDVTIDGADEFIVQDTASFNALTTFNADVDLAFANTENLNINSSVSGTSSVNVVGAVLINNTSSGTQQMAVLQNAAGSGTTEGLLILDNADTNTAVTSGLSITSAAGGITTAIDVSDSDIATALLFGTNDITGTNFSVTGGTGSFTSAGNATIQGGTITVGTTSQAGSLVVHDGSTNTGTLQVAALGQNTVYTLPDPGAGTATICLSTGNCAGAGGGITGSGNVNQLSKFTASGTIGDSSISDDGTTVTTAVDMIIQGGDITVGTSGQLASLILHDGNGHTTTLQAGDSAANLSFILPTAAGSANQCLKQSGSGGQLVWDDCDGGSGGSSVTLQGAYNNGNTIIATDARDIDIVLADTTTDANLDLVVADGSTSFVSFARANGSGTADPAQLLMIENFDTDRALPTGIRLQAAGGGITTAIDASDAEIVDAISVGANNIVGTTGNIDLSNFDVDGATGNLTAGTYNGQTISSTASLTGTLQVAGATTLQTTLAVTGGTTLTGDLAVNGGDITSSGALNITPGGSLVVGSTGQSLTLQGNASTTLTATDGANTTTVDFQTPTADVTYRFAATTAGTYTICTTAGNCTGTAVTLQSAYDNGNSIATSDNRNILFSLANTATDANFVVNIADDSTGTAQINRLNGTGTNSPSQLLMLDNQDTDQAVANGLVIQSAAGGITEGIDVSDADLVNAINVGDNNIVGGVAVIDFTNFDVAANGNITTAGDVAVNGGDITSSGALNITPGGALTVGATGQTATFQGSVTTITSNGAGNDVVINSADTIELQDNTNVTGNADISGTLAVGTANAFTVAANGDVTSSGDATLQGGSVTLGTTSQAGTLVFHDGSTNTGTLQVAALGQNTVYTLPDPGAGTATICLSTGNCAGAGVTLQAVYNNSTNPELTVDATRGALTIRDAATPIGANLLEVQSNDGLTTYFGVDATGVAVAGNATIDGNSTIGNAATDTITINATIQGSTPFVFEGGTADASELSLAIGTLTGDHTVTFGDESGTVCLQNSANCGFATGSAGDYIQNQNSLSQSADFRITGTGRADTALQSPLLDTAAAGALGIGTSNATSITIGNVTNNTPLSLVSGTGTISIGTGAQNRSINIGTGGAVQTVIIGSKTTTSSVTINGGATGEVNIGSTGLVADNSTVNIATAFSGTQNVLIGNNDASSLTLIGGGTINIGTSNVDHNISIGTNSTGVQDVTIGSTGTTSVTAVRAGSGGLSFLSGANVTIGASDTTGTLLVLDTKTSSGDPTGTNGALYYNSNTSKFRCYEDGAWTDCIASSGVATLQTAYNNSTGGTTPEIMLDTTRGGLDIQDNGTSINGILLAVRASAVSGLGNALMSVNSVGVTTFQNTLDSVNAFQILTQGSASIFNVDTDNERVGIGGTATASKFEVIGGDAAIYNSGNNARLVLGDSTAAGQNGFLQWDSANDYFRIETVGTNGLKVNDNYVSIGNIFPDQPLKIANGSTLLSQVSTTGQVMHQNSSDSADAFRILNSAGHQLLDLSSVHNAADVVTNGSLETNTTGWAAKGGSTISRTTTQQYVGIASLQVATTAAANDGAKYNIQLTPSTTYTVSAYYKLSSGTFTNMSIGYSSDGTTDVDCKTGETVKTGGWLSTNCSFTTGGTVSAGAHFYFKQAGATARTVYIDALQIVPGNDIGVYYDGRLDVNGLALNGLSVQPVNDSNSALNVQSSAGTTALGVDTLNLRVGINMLTATAAFDVTTIGTTSVTAEFNQSGSSTLDILRLKKSEDTTFSVAHAGATTLQNLTNSTTAFRVLASHATFGSGTSVFAVDTTNQRVTIGASDTTGALLVLDTKTDATDPTGVNGAMYYNSNSSKFRCYQAGAWADCIASGGTTTLQTAYDNDNSITSTTARDITFNMADTTTDANFLVDLQCDTSCATNGRFAMQDDGSDVFTIAPGSAFGSATFKTSTDIETAFRVTDSADVVRFQIDTVNDRVHVGDPNSTSNGTLFVFDVASSVSNGTNGAMYYSSSYEDFRCYRDGVWQQCNLFAIDRGYMVMDEFLGGNTTGSQIGELGWSKYTYGTGTSNVVFNTGAVTPSGSRPGIVRLKPNDAAGAANSVISLSLNPNTGTGESVSMTVGDMVRTTAAVSSPVSGSQTFRVGLFNQPDLRSNPTSGVWWEANPTTNGNWQYCYVNATPAVVCAASADAINADILERLQIRITGLGSGTSSAVFTINGVSSTVSGVTINTTNLVNNTIGCLDQSSTGRNCYVDYYQFSGVSTSAR